MWLQSGEARAAESLEADIALAGNPLIAGLVQSFPAARKMLKKHPELISLALQKLGGNHSVQAIPSSDSHVQFKF